MSQHLVQALYCECRPRRPREHGSRLQVGRLWVLACFCARGLLIMGHLFNTWLPAMSALFARIYLILLLALLVLGGLAWLLLDGINRMRYQTHVEVQTAWVADLIQQGWQRQSPANREEWVQLVSSLTMVNWERTEPVADENITVPQANWREQSARLQLLLADGQVLSGTLTDWTQWRVGAGYLLLNELSRAAAPERGDRLEALAADLPFPVALVSLQDSPELGVLARRQLAQGQAWVSTRERGLGQVEEWIHVPLGEGFALRLGPTARFSWLTPMGLLGLGGLMLAGLLLVAWAVLSPLRRRLRRITAAVDAIGGAPGEARVPENPADELGRMAGHINRMADRLALTARRNRELNQAVSHDLKTPLARLHFALALLPEDARSTEAAGDIQQAVDDLESLTEELLEYHRLEGRNGTPAEWQAVDVSALIDRLVELLRPSQSVALPSPRSALQLRLEAQDFQRLVQNLLTNAAHYGRRQIHIEQGERDGLWWLSIEDDGPGIPAAERERVLEPFVRLDTARNLNRSGHGLGLAICASLAKAAGGTLELGDSRWSGLRVTLQLPCRQA